MDIDLKARERSVRTVIVSDVHLGCRFSQAEHFLDFINRVRPEQLYILGDFLDGWELRSRWHWNPIYTKIVDRLFDLAASGTEIRYTPGNHDQFLRDPRVVALLEKSGIEVEIQDEFIYETRTGRRFIMLHGDRFDAVEMGHQWLSLLLTHVYKPLLLFNSWFHGVTGRKGSRYSLCAVIKHKVKTAVRFFSHFEERLVQYVHQQGCDGIICGHIHTPGYLSTDAATYINTGDWVENCTALVEDYDGELVLESFFPEVADRPVKIAANSRRRPQRETADLMDDTGVLEPAALAAAEPVMAMAAFATPAD